MVHLLFEPTDLSALTTDLASAFRSAIERAGLRFDVVCAPLSQPAYVDRTMWEKIVLNLVSNAFKFTFDGTIRVSLEEADRHIELRVHDTGVGMAPDQQLRIFDRFQRVEGTRARTHEGSGIGLALVKDLVRLHGGDIRVESAPGAGSTFVVSIPAGRAQLPADRISVPESLTATPRGIAPYVAEAMRWHNEPRGNGGATAEPAPPTTDAASAAPGRARVLVADDNADMREYLVRLLEPFWTVETAADGHRALASIRARPPDLVLSDVMMPGLDGFQLLAAVRADPDLRMIPLILLSARAGEASRVEGLGAGADHHPEVIAKRSAPIARRVRPVGVQSVEGRTPQRDRHAGEVAGGIRVRAASARE